MLGYLQTSYFVPLTIQNAKTVIVISRMTKIIVKNPTFEGLTAANVWHSLLKLMKTFLLDCQTSWQSTKNSPLSRCRSTLGYTEEHIDRCSCAGGALCVFFSFRIRGTTRAAVKNG